MPCTQTSDNKQYNNGDIQNKLQERTTNYDKKELWNRTLKLYFELYQEIAVDQILFSFEFKLGNNSVEMNKNINLAFEEGRSDNEEMIQ